MSTIKVTNVHDTSNNVSLVTDNAGIKTDKLTGNSTASSISVVGEGGSTTTNLQQGLTKFWIQHNDGASVSDSFNAGTTTDHGTGSYTHAFTNNMSAANTYTVAGMAQDVNSKNCQLNMMSSNADYAAASFRYQTGFVANTSGGQTNHDCNGTSVQICGDLA